MRKKNLPARNYDRAQKEPAIRCSICTGEQVAGFVDRESYRFEEVMLIRGENDLRDFCAQYGIDEPPRRIY